MALNVLNPRGRDPEQAFPDGPGKPGDPGHAPVNFHAYAACSGGGFYADTARCIAAGQPVLVLIRHRLRQSLKAVREIKAAGLPCFVSWKETGLQQVSAKLDASTPLQLFTEIVDTADGVITASDELIPLYEWAGAQRIHFVPTPYPVAQTEWSHSKPRADRDGIFIGTRSFRHLYRNHLLALTAAASLATKHGCRLTVINSEGRDGERLIASLGVPADQLTVAEPQPYVSYLNLMSEHCFVMQFDLGGVPGQVAGDALLCRMPCVGGNGVIDRLCFPHLCGGTRGNEELKYIAERLLTEHEYWQRSVDHSQTLGQERVAFKVVERRLAEITAV